MIAGRRAKVASPLIPASWRSGPLGTGSRSKRVCVRARRQPKQPPAPTSPVTSIHLIFSQQGKEVTSPPRRLVDRRVEGGP